MAVGAIENVGAFVDSSLASLKMTTPTDGMTSDSIDLLQMQLAIGDDQEIDELNVGGS